MIQTVISDMAEWDAPRRPHAVGGAPITDVRNMNEVAPPQHRPVIMKHRQIGRDAVGQLKPAIAHGGLPMHPCAGDQPTKARRPEDLCSPAWRETPYQFESTLEGLEYREEMPRATRYFADIRQLEQQPGVLSTALLTRPRPHTRNFQTHPQVREIVGL